MDSGMRKRVLSVVAVLLLIAGAAVLSLALNLSGGNNGNDKEDGVPLAVGTPLPTRVPENVVPTATPPKGDPRLAALAIQRLVVPKVGINAPIVIRGILPDGTMASPDGPEEVAWYTFSSKPGEIGNVVMAGHLDYINYGAAVFYRLKDLRPGDEMQVVLEDKTIVKYAVESVNEYDEATAPIADIVGRTPNEAITLITCSGSFDRASLHYNKRLVVRGARILG